MPRNTVTACIATLLLASLAAADPPRDQLGKRDLLEWSNELLTGIGKADRETVELAIGVFARAGQADRSETAVRRLCQLPVTTPERNWIACELGRLEQWGALRVLLDAFEDTELYEAQASALVARWRASGDRAALEAWLGRRAKVSAMWRRQLYVFLQGSGTLELTCREIRSKIEKSPDDFSAIGDYLIAASVLDKDRPEDLAWLGRIARPRRAIDSMELGMRLGRVKMHEAAIRLLDLSLATPLTEGERQEVRRTISMRLVDGEAVDSMIRNRAKACLARMLLESGQADRAQKLAEELTGRKGAPLEELAYFELAGAVQQASGQRVIEEKIRQAEKDNENSVRYWLSRADYYRGRREPARQEEAIKKALALRDDRHWMRGLIAYGEFLMARKDWQKLDGFLRDEIKRPGRTSETAESCVMRLLEHNRKGQLPLAADDALLWDWLAGCPIWQRAHEELLLAFASAGNPEATHRRMDALVGKDADGTRFVAQAEVYRRAGDHKRAVAALQAALGKPRRGYLPREMIAHRLLWESLAAGDWKLARRVLPEPGATDLWHPDGREALGRMAVLAAKDGAVDEAMGIYRRLGNTSLIDHRHIGEMVRAGMGDRLRGFYEELLKKDPKNQAVLGALKEIAVNQAMLKREVRETPEKGASPAFLEEATQKLRDAYASKTQEGHTKPEAVDEVVAWWLDAVGRRPVGETAKARAAFAMGLAELAVKECTGPAKSNAISGVRKVLALRAGRPADEKQEKAVAEIAGKLAAAVAQKNSAGIEALQRELVALPEVSVVYVAEWCSGEAVGAEARFALGKALYNRGTADSLDSVLSSLDKCKDANMARSLRSSIRASISRMDPAGTREWR